MGMIGEIYALVGLHVNQASFAQASADMMAVGKSADEVTNKFNLLQTGILAAPAIAVGAMAAAGMSVATGMQDAALTLETVYNSVDVAKEKFLWLRDFAASTPFEFPELLQTTIQLRNAGLEAENFITNFGNTASVFNRGITDVSHAVISAMNGEWEALRSFGITSVEITSKNAEALGVSVEAIGQRALLTTDKYGKQIVATVEQTNKAAIASTINDLMGKYEGQMQQRAQTITGLYSTLRDNIGMSLAGIVGFTSDMEVRTFSLMGLMQGLMEIAVGLTDRFLNMSEGMQVFISVVAGSIAVISAAAVAISLYGLAADLATIKIGILDMTIGATLLPLAGIVVAVGLVVTALWELNERTGVLTDAWNLLTDIVVVVTDALSNLWDSFSSGASYAIAQAIQYFEDLYDVLYNLATSIHLDDLLNFAWDVSPIRIAYEALKAIWDILSEWAGGIGEKADTIRAANEDAAASATELGTATETAAGQVSTAEGNMATSATGASGTVQTAHKGIVQSLTDWATGSNNTTSTVVGNNEKVVTSTQNTLSAYQKAVNDMLTEQQGLLDLTNNAGVTGAPEDVRKDISPTGKGIEVKSGSSEYGQGIIGYDPVKGEQVLTYYKNVDGQIQKVSVSLAYLNKVGQDTFMTEDGLIRTVTYDRNTDMKALDEYIGKEKEKGVTVIPIDMEILRNKKDSTRATQENSVAVRDNATATEGITAANQGATAAVKGTTKAENDLNMISLAEAANQNRLPGAAAGESANQVKGLGNSTQGLNGVKVTGFSMELLNPGINANASGRNVSALGNTTSGLNGISITGFNNSLLRPGQSAQTSSGNVSTLGSTASGLNGISLTGLINSLLRPGQSANSSSGLVRILNTNILGLNGISIAGIINSLLRPGQSANSSSGLIRTLALNITGLNVISLAGIINSLLRPGQSANSSSGLVRILNTNILGLNGISLSGIINSLLRPGQSANTSSGLIRILSATILGLNGLSLATIIATLLRPGTSADTSTGRVGLLARTISALNSISLSGISSRLSSLYNQAVETGKKIAETLLGGGSSNNKSGNTTNVKVNTVNNNGSTNNTNAARSTIKVK